MPACPDDLWDLYTLAQQLVGRSGVTMNGHAPMTFDTMERGARLLGYGALSVRSVRALLVLDTVLCNPNEPDVVSDGAH